MKHTASVLVSSDFIRSHLDSAAKLVYLAIASRTNTSRLAVVPLREIARMSNVSINTVRHAIHTLQSHGYIVVHRCIGQSHIYQLRTNKHQKNCIAIPTSLICNRIMSTTSKIVYAILLTFKGYSQSKCCPSMRTIATYIGASVRTVQRAIATLRGCNAITTVCVATDGAYPHNEYTLHNIDDATDMDMPARTEQYNTKLCTYCAAEAEENEQKKARVGTANSDTGNLKNITNYISEMYYTSDTQQSQATITIDDLKAQISYDWLVAQHNGVSADIDNCITAIIDGLHICANKPIIISGHQYDYAAYTSAVRQLTADHIQLAIEHWRLRARSTLISNPLAYLRSVVINALCDIDLHYAGQVEFDTYN